MGSSVGYLTSSSSMALPKSISRLLMKYFLDIANKNVTMADYLNEVQIIIELMKALGDIIYNNNQQ